MRALIVLGTRPEAIKLAPVISECKSRANIDVTVCSTGQHKEMLAQALGDDEPLARSRSAPVRARETKCNARAATLRQLAGVDKSKKPRSSLGRFWPMSPNSRSKSLNSSTDSPEDKVDNGESRPSSPAQMIKAWFAKSERFETANL